MNIFEKPEEVFAKLKEAQRLNMESLEILREVGRILGNLAGRDSNSMEAPADPAGPVEDNGQTFVVGMGFDLAPGETRGGSN